MRKNITVNDKSHDIFGNGFNDALTEILKKGARELLTQAIENEVNEYIERF